MSRTRTHRALPLAAVTAALLLAVGCGTEPDRAEPTPSAAPLADPIRGQVVDRDAEAAGYTSAGPMGDMQELTVCLLDVNGEPTDECMEVWLQPDKWEGYAVGDPYPVEGTWLDSRNGAEQ